MLKTDDPIYLSDRAIITLSGAQRKPFLQRLVSNDMNKLGENKAIYAALLSPQGKYLHDFFILEQGSSLYLDCEKDRLPDLLRRLMMFKLRTDVDIKDCRDKYTVFAAQISDESGIITYPDPRLSDMGYRTIQEISPKNARDSSHYDRLRLSHGLPDGARDFEVDRTLILEGNMAELNGVDFEKGCYVGQEVTARMTYRMSLKKRLLPVKLKGVLPERGTAVTNEDGRKIGDIRSGFEDQAIGYFRLAHMKFGQSYHCGDATVTPWQPKWLKEYL